jgi:hypothetical protein
LAERVAATKRESVAEIRRADVNMMKLLRSPPGTWLMCADRTGLLTDAILASHVADASLPDAGRR